MHTTLTRWRYRNDQCDGGIFVRQLPNLACQYVRPPLQFADIVERRGTRVPGEFAVSTISNGESNFSDPTWYVLLSIEYLTWHIFLLLVRLRRNRAVKAALPFALTG